MFPKHGLRVRALGFAFLSGLSSICAPSFGADAVIVDFSQAIGQAGDPVGTYLTGAWSSPLSLPVSLYMELDGNA